MRLDKFTIKSQEAIEAARRQAEERRHQQIDVEHLLLALLEQEEGVVPPILEKLGASRQQIRSQVQQELQGRRQSRWQDRDHPAPQPGVGASLEEAQRLNDEYVSTEHLLLAITDAGDPAQRILRGRRQQRRHLQAMGGARRPPRHRPQPRGELTRR